VDNPADKGWWGGSMGSGVNAYAITPSFILGYASALKIALAFMFRLCILNG
jgi:hypothetical protein